MLRGLSAVFVMLASSAALAKPPPRIITVEGPPQNLSLAALPGSTLFFNQCQPSCTVMPGSPNATTDTSNLVSNPATLIGHAWEVGQWEAIMQCVREVYSPYNINITDVRPAAGTNYNEVFVAGSPTDIGAPPDSGGIALVSSDCTPYQNVPSFVFAEALDAFTQEESGNAVFGACWVMAQESAHLYGLDHEFSFTDDGTSACNDPMTYRDDCGGEKFFRNRFAKCGEFGPARPACGPSNACQTTQNSHQKLITVFGPGTPITTPPVVSITDPAANATIGNNALIHATASSQRGIQTMELWLNGFKWADLPGSRFGSMGQLPNDYPLQIPADVPDSVIDVTVKAFDDLGTETDATVTVTKNKACSDAATDCLTGQKCESGKCFWDPPSKNVGDTCTYAQECISLDCEGDNTTKICTQSCIPNTGDACPAGLDCVASSPTMGVCFLPDSGGGCCSVGSPGSVWAHAGFGLFVLAMLLRRRRR
jgi:MYXO-CTERM domain-containing protein